MGYSMKKLKVCGINSEKTEFYTDCPFKKCDHLLYFHAGLFDNKFWKAHCEEYDVDLYQKPPVEVTKR